LELPDYKITFERFHELAMIREGEVAMRTIFSLCCLLLAIASSAARTSHAPKQVDVHFRFQENVVTLHEPTNSKNALQN
jgi:hypothetical protein